MEAIAADSIVEGKVTGITKFGAFVDLGDRRVGLIHISQVANSYVTDINQHLKVGDPVKVRVISVTKDGKYDLSIKQLEKREEKKFDKGPRPFDKGPRQFGRREPRVFSNSFEDKLTAFLKQSDEKQLDQKKNLQEKQEGKKRKKIVR